MSRATKSDSAVTTIPPLDGWRTFSCDEGDDFGVVVEIIDVFGCAAGGGRNAFVDCITAVAAADSSNKDVLVMMTVLSSVFLQWIALERITQTYGDVFRHDAFQTF